MPVFIGQGQGPTTVMQGDVNIGLKLALQDLEAKLGVETITYDEFFATSSAAGGLRMTVHGLVHDMTVKAAKEAALGAGANIHFVTSGKLSEFDLYKINEINPNIILVAGGVDYGERMTALDHIHQLCQMDSKVPIIYAGNKVNQDEVKFLAHKYKRVIHVVDNVYPKIDQLNILPTRKVIQEVFEDHIIHAPGMTKVREIVNQNIMPTPGAVMESTRLLGDTFNDLMTIDVGGATTDVHSFTEGVEESNDILIHPEPRAKRTVEGDLGVYVNQKNIIDLVGQERMAGRLNISEEELNELRKHYSGVPKTDLEKKYVSMLTECAVRFSVERHCGKRRFIYTGSGKKEIIEGKDLRNIKAIIGTGGALTRLESGETILKSVNEANYPDFMLPKEPSIYLDSHYIMASLGVLSLQHPDKARKLLLKSLCDHKSRGGDPIVSKT